MRLSRSTTFVLACALGAGLLPLPVALPAAGAPRDPAVSAGSSPSSGPPGSRAVRVDAVAPVDWGPCDAPDLPPVPASYRCATYPVPLDHADPDGASIGIALMQRPADDAAARQGSLFVNFGGPGGPGVDTLAQAGEFLYPAEVTDAFDIVGFDPRGIGRSAPLRCFDGSEDPSRFFTSFTWPESGRDLRLVRLTNAALDRQCDAVGGPIRDHMSTTAVADDLDLLRQAVGDPELTFVGYSYGSYVGAMYAARYPDTVGAVVVDGVIDPVDWATGRPGDEALPISARLDSDDGAQDTLDEFFRLCDEAGPERCAVAGGAADRFASLYEQLRADPVVLEDEFGSFEIDHQLLTNIALGAMYSSPTWSLFALDLVFVEQLAAGEVGPDDSRAAAVTRRARDTLEPSYTGTEQFIGVTCSDGVSPDRVQDWSRADRRRSVGYFGPLWTWSDQQCQAWQGIDVDRYLGPFDIDTANPVLVAGPRYDPATAFSGAVDLRAELPNSRLLTVEGWGHTTLGLSVCADAVTTEYLLTQDVPDGDVVCTQDVDPFPVGGLPSEPGPGARSVPDAEPLADPRAEALVQQLEQDQGPEVADLLRRREQVLEAVGTGLRAPGR